jgi:hypothetical protein
MLFCIGNNFFKPFYDITGEMNFVTYGAFVAGDVADDENT